MQICILTGRLPCLHIGICIDPDGVGANPDHHIMAISLSEGEARLIYGREMGTVYTEKVMLPSDLILLRASLERVGHDSVSLRGTVEVLPANVMNIAGHSTTIF